MLEATYQIIGLKKPALEAGVLVKKLVFLVVGRIKYTVRATSSHIRFEYSAKMLTLPLCVEIGTDGPLLFM